MQSEGNDPNALNLGSRMETSQAITITRIRFYKLAASTGTHTAHVWSSDGSVIATQAFTGEFETSDQARNEFLRAIAGARRVD